MSATGTTTDEAAEDASPVETTQAAPSPVVLPELQSHRLKPAAALQQQTQQRPPPLPTPFSYHIPGLDREKAWGWAYQILYNPPSAVYDPRTNRGWTRLRNFTRGRVIVQPHIEFQVRRNLSAQFWPRDVRMRDPWERFLAVMSELFSTKTLPEQFREAMRPKLIEYGLIMKTDRFIPLRNAAPVWIEMSRLGICVALYAEILFCGVNLQVKRPVPFLVVKPLDPFGGASTWRNEYRGNLWWVPMAACLPLRCAPMSWPTPERGGDLQPDEVVLLWEDGFARVAPLQYVLQDPSREMVEARCALFAQYPDGFGAINIPMAANTPDQEARMGRYSVVRYLPQSEVEEQQGEEENEDAGASVTTAETASPSVPVTSAPAASQISCASQRLLPW